METLDEIVFEKRNRTYGSYVLRKNYHKYVLTSLVIAFFFLGLLIAYPVIAGYMNKGKLTKLSGPEVGIEMLATPKEDFTPPPPPPAAPMTAPKFIAPTVVDEDVETNMETQDNLSTKPNNAPSSETEFAVPETTAPPVIETPNEPAPIFTVVEEQPFLTDMYVFLSNNIKYPQEAKEIGIQGVVYVTFVVEKDGSIADVKVLRGIGGGCDEEAVRVIQSMPKWSPGKQRGNAVRVQFNLPVRFRLN